MKIAKFLLSLSSLAALVPALFAQDEVLVNYKSFYDDYLPSPSATDLFYYFYVPVVVGTDKIIDLDDYFVVLKKSDPDPVVTFKFRPAIITGKSGGYTTYEEIGTTSIVKRGEEDSIQFDLHFSVAPLTVEHFWQDISSGYYENTIVHRNPYIDGYPSHKLLGFGRYQLPESDDKPLTETNEDWDPFNLNPPFGESGSGHGIGTLAYAFKLTESSLFINLTDNTSISGIRRDLFGNHYTFATIKSDDLERLKPLTSAATYDLSAWYEVSDTFLPLTNIPFYAVDPLQASPQEHQNFVTFDSAEITSYQNYIDTADLEITFESYEEEEDDDDEPNSFNGSVDIENHQMKASAGGLEELTNYKLEIKLNETISSLSLIRLYSIHPLMAEIFSNYLSYTNQYNNKPGYYNKIGSFGDLEFSSADSNEAYNTDHGEIWIKAREVGGVVQKDAFFFWDSRTKNTFYVDLKSYPKMYEYRKNDEDRWVEYLVDSPINDNNAREFYDYTKKETFLYHDLVNSIFTTEDYTYEHIEDGDKTYYHNNSFGWFFVKQNEDNNYIYHTVHGWIKIYPLVAGETFWFYDHGLKSWVFTNLKSSRWFWVKDLNSWCFHYLSGPYGKNYGEGRWFYNSATSAYFQVPLESESGS